jgi:protein-tyrosine kinase
MATEMSMGRVEEALRRAGVETSAAHGGNGGTPSPWEFEPASSRSVGSEPRRSGSLSEIIPGANLSDWRFREFSPEWRDRLIGSSSIDPALVEQFRRLGATLHHTQSSDNLKVIMVTSAAPGDGKTMTSMNLSLVLSGSYGRRVLLMDADLRRPSIQALSQLPNTPGLSDALKAGTAQRLSVFSITENLVLLPAGRPEADPMGALTSPRMQHILEEAQERFDWVIIDAPPAGPVADATLLAQRVGAIVFVVRAGRTPYPAVQKAIDSLGRERILGIVLNGVSAAVASGYGYYRDYGVYQTN